jgi:hypothetical protein
MSTASASLVANVWGFVSLLALAGAVRFLSTYFSR